MAVELRRGRHNRHKVQNNNKEPPKKKAKKANELRELALQEIATLNDEICHLEEEIFQKESTYAGDYNLETLERIESELLDNDQPCSSKENDKSELEKDIEVLNNKFNSLENFTGIRFVENEVSVLSKTGSRTVLLRRMSGTCQRIPFTVEFEVEENEQMESLERSDSKGQSAVKRTTQFMNVSLVTNLRLNRKKMFEPKIFKVRPNECSHVMEMQEPRQVSPIKKMQMQAFSCMHLSAAFSSCWTRFAFLLVFAFAVYIHKLEISLSQNLAKLFGGISICVRGFSPFRFIFLESKNVGRRSFRWFAYRLPTAIFVYHALPQVFPSSSCLTSLKLCCTVARQLHGHLHIYIYFSLEFARLSSRGTTNLLTLLRSGLRPSLREALNVIQQNSANLRSVNSKSK